MSRKHPTEKELLERLRAFPRTLPPMQVVKKLGGMRGLLENGLDRTQLQNAVVELAKDYLEELRLAHNARGPCQQLGCSFNPATHLGKGGTIKDDLEKALASSPEFGTG